MTKWKPFAGVAAAVGGEIVGALVAKECPCHMCQHERPTSECSSCSDAECTLCESGVLCGQGMEFDNGKFEWLVKYRNGSTEALSLEDLNRRLQQRFQRDYQGIPDLQPPNPSSSACSAELDALLENFDPKWATSQLAYDSRHFMV